MGKLAIIKNRLYNDYFMPSRLKEYESILQAVSNEGYEHITIKEYYYRLRTDTLGGQKYFINRHDIDTDVATAKAFFKIEQKYNAKATYYFRRSTLDIALMKSIDAYGSEASYHFEEIAQYCKEHHIKNHEEARHHFEEIKVLFRENFQMIEAQTGIKLETVCSHGDFVNRALDLVNYEILKEKHLREDLGICCEAYDKELMESFDSYISDAQYPKFYTPHSIFEVIGKERVICMLSHPRQWRTHFFVNTYDNLKRVYEGFRW